MAKIKSIAKGLYEAWVEARKMQAEHVFRSRRG
jgi:hypothetical protein